MTHSTIQPPATIQPLAIAASTLVTAVGHGGAATLAALRDRRGGLIPCDFEPGGNRQVGHIGRVFDVEHHTLSGSLARFDCRNNRLADLALATDGFSDVVARARTKYGAERIGVVLGTSTSGVLSCENAYRQRHPETGALPREFDFLHTHDMFSLADFVAARLGLRGPAMVISSACASSALSFVDAFRLIACGVCDAVIAGGADSLCQMTLQGFSALELISELPCRPCDVSRSGISIGEAAGFVLLERAEPGCGRKALLGYGATSDGHHMSAPHPEGAGAIGAMGQALARAGLPPDAIDYVNLHGTGTPANDAIEDFSVFETFGGLVPCSSTKGWTGHTLGAAGVIDAIVSLLCIEHGLLPGCLNVTRTDPAFRCHVLTGNVERKVEHVVSNSFGFGGVNCSLVLGTVA